MAGALGTIGRTYEGDCGLNYTLAITSCDRMDLLERSFLSFMECADVPPSAIIIVDDGDAPEPEFLKRFRHIPTKWINNGARRGQVFSLDALYREVKTPYVFHTEDDFEFTGGDFIRKSFAILEKYPRIGLVALRSDWHHPIADGDPEYNDFKLAMPYWRGVWGGATWNPGLRRLADIKQFGPMAKYGKQNGLEHEALMSKAFLDAGYRIAIGPKCCHHIGDGRSRAIEKIEFREPKILIAVKAGRRLSYGAWESEKSPHFNSSTAYRMNGRESYDTGENPIHVSGDNPRLAAVRETWFKDAVSHPAVTAKFFYGQSDIQPLEDEVNLNVPDDYGHLADKTRAICRWAVDNNFDYAALVDDDTLVYVDRLVDETESAAFDYAGHVHGSVATGGPGYILSRRAMEAISKNWHSHWAEDVACGKSLFYSGITPENLVGHKSGKSNHFFFADGFDASLLTDDVVTAHAVSPDDLRKWYAHKNNG
jgi:hypothetical protein